MNENKQITNWLGDFNVKNTFDEEVPPYGAMKIIDWDPDEEVWLIIQPDEDDEVCSICFNGPVAIPADGYGTGTMIFPARARVATMIGNAGCGVVADSWALANNHSGFFAVSNHDSDSESQEVVRPFCIYA